LYTLNCAVRLLCWFAGLVAVGVTVLLLVREVLKAREGDYLRLIISGVIKKKQRRKEKAIEFID